MARRNERNHCLTDKACVASARPLFLDARRRVRLALDISSLTLFCPIIPVLNSLFQASLNMLNDFREEDLRAYLLLRQNFGHLRDYPSHLEFVIVFSFFFLMFPVRNKRLN